MMRLDELTVPVEVGKRYLVPTVRGQWHDRVDDWPVIGPQHNDKHCLNFKWQHYHLDVRFVRSPPRRDEENYFRAVASGPLMVSERINPEGLPAPVWRPRLCKRIGKPILPTIQTLVAGAPAFRCLSDGYIGKQASHDGRGWVCPHRGVPLADHAAVAGVIVCPLHFLRIDATSGIVLPMTEASDAA